MSRILLVEDDVDVRVAMENVLLDGGYKVDATATAEGAFGFLSCSDYDLIVADGRLGDGTGMTVADRGQERGIPSLIVTGYAFIFEELRVKPERYGVLLKPLHPNELLDAVGRALDAL